MKEILKKRITKAVLLLLTAIISFFVVAEIASSPKVHSGTIEALDEKKITVMELTAGATAASVALASVPGDATTPIANQITEISSYLLIVVCAILLEKFLVTLTGLAAFKFLIPIACLLGIAFLYLKKQVLKNLAVKLVAFGLVIFMVIPISVQLSNIIEETYDTSIETTIRESEEIKKDAEDVSKKASAEEKNLWDSISNSVTSFVGKIGDTISDVSAKAKEWVSGFIDAIAVLMITSCVIPIAVIFFMIWIVKIIFGININIPKKEKIIKKEKVSEPSDVQLNA